MRSSSPRSFAAVRLEAARGGGGGPAPDRGSACKLSSGGSFAKPGCAPGSRRALSESHARGGGAGGRGVNGAPESSHTWPCGLMDKALVFGTKMIAGSSPAGVTAASTWVAYQSLPVRRHLVRMETLMSTQALSCSRRGLESACGKLVYSNLCCH